MTKHTCSYTQIKQEHSQKRQSRQTGKKRRYGNNMVITINPSWTKLKCSQKLSKKSNLNSPISLVKASISSCVELFALWGFTSVVGFPLVSSTSGSIFRLWVSEGWVALATLVSLALEDLLSNEMGLSIKVGALTPGTFRKTAVIFWEALGADTGAGVGLIASVVVFEQGLVSSTHLGDMDWDGGLSSNPPFPPESAGEHFPPADDMNRVSGVKEAVEPELWGTQGTAVVCGCVVKFFTELETRAWGVWGREGFEGSGVCWGFGTVAAETLLDEETM